MQLKINQNRREIKNHGTFAFPVMVSHEVLSSYERSSFFWHWHPEVELTLILEGDIRYQVNDQTYHLKAGDGLFCNSNMPHTGTRQTSADCIYVSITFHPKIIYGFESSLLQTNYISPITLNSEPPSLAFRPEVPWQNEILVHLREIWTLKKAPEQYSSNTYEFRVQLLLAQIWLVLYEHAAPQNQVSPATIRDRERIMAILSYLHAHYAEKIKLKDIAACINLCPSECCRLFKKQMKESIFDYLLRYRIEKSLTLLAESEDSITDISLKTGFTNPCYFSKVFREEMKSSPREYRQSAKGPTSTSGKSPLQ